MASPTTNATDGTGELRWRLGNRNPRNLYLGETHVGMLIEPELAAQIVATMNAAGREGAEDGPTDGLSATESARDALPRGVGSPGCSAGI